MSSVANVAIHASQFPESVRRDLIESLRTRQINPKFHYDSYKQSQKWLALHQAHSPSRTDVDCAAAYDRSFQAAVTPIRSSRVHLIGLGCGGGQKDSRLLYLLKARSISPSYTPCDVSLALVLAARKEAARIVSPAECHPLVCDLGAASDLPEVIGQWSPPETPRLLTFFGMIPNFEPTLILPRLAALLRPEDGLLFSANLAPGTDYEAGIRQIMPGYDNDLTRDWLITFLLNLGMESMDGECRFTIEDGEENLKRIVATWRFNRVRKVALENEEFLFGPDDELRLFYSYRYTPDRLSAILRMHHLAVTDQWITRSEEEGVFLCTKAGE